MAAYTPFTTPPSQQQEESHDNEDIFLPHSLELIVSTRAALIELEALSLQAKNLLKAKANPLNAPVAEALIDQIHRRIVELIALSDVS